MARYFTSSVVLRVSERSEHTVVLSVTFLYIYLTKILRKIRATTFMESYGNLHVRGG